MIKKKNANALIFVMLDFLNKFPFLEIPSSLFYPLLGSYHFMHSDMHCRLYLVSVQIIPQDYLTRRLSSVNRQDSKRASRFWCHFILAIKRTYIVILRFVWLVAQYALNPDMDKLRPASRIQPVRPFNLACQSWINIVYSPGSKFREKFNPARESKSLPTPNLTPTVAPR